MVSAATRFMNRLLVVSTRLSASRNVLFFTKIVMGSSRMSRSNRKFTPDVLDSRSNTSLSLAFWNRSVMGCVEVRVNSSDASSSFFRSDASTIALAAAAWAGDNSTARSNSLIASEYFSVLRSCSPD